MEFDLAALAPLERYKLVTGLVVPRPIAFVSTVSPIGALNAAPFSFFNAFGASPAVVVLGINTRPTGQKDTLRNIVALGEFVVNVATAALADKLNAASGDYAAHADEFSRVGLTPLPSRVVRPPRIAESPAHLECRLMQTVPLKDGPNLLVVGEIVHIHADDALLDGTKVDPDRLDAIGRMGGPTYNYTRDRFDLARPVIEGPDAL